MKITYQNKKKNPPAPVAAVWIRRLILAWLTAAATEYLLLDAPLRDLTGLAGIAQMSAVRMLAVGAAVVLVCTLWKGLSDQAERWLIVAAAAVLSVLALAASFTWPLLAACALVLAVLAVYALRGWQSAGLTRGTRVPDKKGYVWGVVLGAAMFFALVSAWTVARVLSFSVPTFDFGIFSQMFHSMKTTGLPITTVERDGALSHFAVHVSPIYYLLLPFYCLVPRPATLQVLQAAVLASAVIPAWKLGRHHGLSTPLRMLLCLVLLFMPSFAGGASYDIHENAFLTPLILWLFYGIDRRSVPITAVSAVLTLMVKEDAAVYVAVIALYLLLRSILSEDKKWGLITGFALLAGALVWFAAATGYLARSGDGVMTYRYKNFMYDGSSSLVTVVKAVLLSPMKAVFECVDPEKLGFIGLTLLPLLGLPLLTRRYERYVLLIPYLLVNLMSDYQYQHNIFYQYTYGSTGCLVYLSLMNLADIRLEKRRLAAILAALAVSASCFCTNIIPKVTQYTGTASTYSDYYSRIRSVLDVVPEDASVAATTFYTTYLSQRDVLYDVRYASLDHVMECEYLALSVTDTKSYKFFEIDGENGYENFVDFLALQGYVKIAEYPGRLEVFQRIQ